MYYIPTKCFFCIVEYIRNAMNILYFVATPNHAIDYRVLLLLQRDYKAQRNPLYRDASVALWISAIPYYNTFKVISNSQPYRGLAISVH